MDAQRVSGRIDLRRMNRIRRFTEALHEERGNLR